MKFTKMHGIGNDYVYIDTFTQNIPNKSDVVVQFSDRHFGIGGDGVIFINPSDEADCEMEMYNADGSRSEMCGNGIRCVAKYVYDKGIVDKKEMTIVSMGKVKYITVITEKEEPNPLTGIKYGKREDGMVVSKVIVDMGEAILEPDKIPVVPTDASDKAADYMVEIEENSRCVACPITVDGTEYSMTCVSMGNPHAVMFRDDVSGMKIETIGPLVENHKCFPKRVNAEFINVIDRKNVEMRVWERGTGETLACGTGACASTVACILNGYTDDEITVHLLGGDLNVKWNRDNGHVIMTGPASTVFEGEI